MRPVYCKESDRQNETAVVARVTAGLNKFQPGKRFTFRPGQKFDHFDATIFADNSPYAIVEVKNRTGSGDRYPTWHISHRKFQDCMAEAIRLKVKFFLAFAWDGVVYVCDGHKVSGMTLRFEQGGRTDRGDAADIETMMHIPREVFFQVPA